MISILGKKSPWPSVELKLEREDKPGLCQGGPWPQVWAQESDLGHCFMRALEPWELGELVRARRESEARGRAWETAAFKEKKQRTA